jgi:AraC-like DNA-binding protein
MMNFSATALSGVTLLDAPLGEHRFDKHVHDTYAFGVTLQGVQTFNCRGTRYANPPGSLIAFNPDECHDGEPGSPEGFSYRILYVEPQALQSLTRHRELPHFRTASLNDETLSGQLMRAILATQPQETLRAETLLENFLLCVTRQHGRTRVSDDSPTCDLRARRMRDYLRARVCEDVSTAELASIAEVSRVHANRLFNQAYGISPHAYLNALRVMRAKQLICSGESLADAAVASGFADQAHMSRRFLAAVGVSPYRYRKSTTLPN